MNILWIMVDQLRWDYLSCTGHPRLHTPNIDALAARGVLFSQAYVQAPLCGPSRGSFYTGRYVSTHGALINSDPMPLGERYLGDYLSDKGYHCALIGKTHTATTRLGLARMGIAPDNDDYQRWQNGGFAPLARHEGLYPDAIVPPDLAYNAYLRAQGYAADNPWEAVSNGAQDPAGERQSGWLLRNAHLPSRVPEAHSETAWCSNLAIDFLRTAATHPETPFCLHLSYIKPHWPLLASAPYHALYTADDVPAAIGQDILEPVHPVMAAFQQAEYSRNYADPNIRRHVIPTYMGLIKQLDDHLGRVFAALSETGLQDNTLVIFSSDHGDYLGDHRLGEKDLFHDCSVRIPLIIADPRGQANAMRGQYCDAFVEAVDILPTCLAAANIACPQERIEGRSLQPLIHGEPIADWREYVISEIDYSDRGARQFLEQAPYDCRAWMVRDTAWKYVYFEGFRAQLFDLNNDPQECHDLGDDPRYAAQREHYQRLLFRWFRRRKVRSETPFEQLDQLGPEHDEAYGIVIGRW